MGHYLSGNLLYEMNHAPQGNGIRKLCEKDCVQEPLICPCFASNIRVRFPRRWEVGFSRTARALALRPASQIIFQFDCPDTPKI